MSAFHLTGLEAVRPPSGRFWPVAGESTAPANVQHGHAVAPCDLVFVVSGRFQRRKGVVLVGRAHGRAHDVLDQREPGRVLGRVDEAVHLQIGRNRALCGERLQGAEPLAAGMDVEEAVVAVVDAEDLPDTVGADVGKEFGLGACRDARLTHVFRREAQLVARDLADGGGFYGWVVLD